MRETHGYALRKNKQETPTEYLYRLCRISIWINFVRGLVGEYVFKKTRIRLTFLNAIVFFIMIAVLSVVIYAYCSFSIYKSVNSSLQSSISFFEKIDWRGSQYFTDIDLTGDPRVDIIFWNEKGEIVQASDRYFLTQEEAFRPSTLNSFEKVNMPKYDFQTITIAPEIDLRLSQISQDADHQIALVQFVQGTNSEQELLDNLLLILVIGNLVGAVLVVGIGFFLSGKALVPINRAWRRQQQFVSDASHELRTPLTVIQTRTDLLLRNPEVTIEEKVTDVSAISKETRRLSKLVANLLTLARSDSNQLEISQSDFRLDLLLREIVDQFIDISEFQGKTLRLETAENIVLYGDKEKIHQLVVILVDNALKFTALGGVIEIECKKESNYIQMQVSDNGAGIKAEHIEKVFDRFFRGDKSRTNQEGTGLGLSIAKWIVDKHHGRIKVDSIENEGTTFTITLNSKKESKKDNKKDNQKG